MKEKKIVYLFLLTTMSLIVLLLSALYIYDPLQVFHKAWGREVTFGKNMRQQVAGIIKHYDNYDSIILGTCMMENTSSKEANQKLGGEFINISFPDGTYFERAIVLRSLFQEHKIRNILFSLDVNSYFKQKKDDLYYPLSQFDFLYDENFWNDFKVYFNYKYLPCTFLMSKSERCVGKAVTLDRPNAWFGKKRHSDCYGGLDKWIACKDNSAATTGAIKNISETVQHIKDQEKKSLNDVNTTISKAKAYIDENILSFVRREPKTRFILVDPPYSRIHYATWAQYNLPKFEVYKAILRYLAEKSDEYSNLEVYSFGEEQFIDDISTYKDTIHYHYSIDSWMLSAISQKRGLLHENTIGHYLENITKRALNYDLVELNYTIQNN